MVCLDSLWLCCFFFCLFVFWSRVSETCSSCCCKSCCYCGISLLVIIFGILFDRLLFIILLPSLKPEKLSLSPIIVGYIQSIKHVLYLVALSYTLMAHEYYIMYVSFSQWNNKTVNKMSKNLERKTTTLNPWACRSYRSPIIHQLTQVHDWLEREMSTCHPSHTKSTFRSRLLAMDDSGSVRIWTWSLKNSDRTEILVLGSAD